MGKKEISRWSVDGREADDVPVIEWSSFGHLRIRARTPCQLAVVVGFVLEREKNSVREFSKERNLRRSTERDQLREIEREFEFELKLTGAEAGG